MREAIKKKIGFALHQTPAFSESSGKSRSVQNTSHCSSNGGSDVKARFLSISETLETFRSRRRAGVGGGVDAMSIT